MNIEQAYDIEQASNDAIDAEGARHPDNGIGVKDGLHIGAWGLVDAGLAENHEQGLHLILEARRTIGARRAFLKGAFPDIGRVEDPQAVAAEHEAEEEE